MYMDELSNPITVDFPFGGGEREVPNTPAKVIPSHVTDEFGQRYVYDFVIIDWSCKGSPF